ncbi:MAG: ATP-binding protein, partial [Spirulinaceae cyanobacterium]
EEIAPAEPIDEEFEPSIEDAAALFDDAAPATIEAADPESSLESAAEFFAPEEPAYVESSPSVEDATALFQDAAESETEVFVTEEIAPAEPIDEEFEPSIEDAAALFDDAAPATIEAADPESSLESAAEFFAPEEPAHAESFPSVEDVTALFQDAAESETEVFVTEEIAPAEPIDEEFEPSIEDAAALFDDAAETPTEAADPESESLESAAAFFVDEAVVAEEIEPGESASESSPQAAESDSAEQIEPVLPERLPTEFTHPQPRLPQQHENYATFITEAQDLLQTLEQELLALTPPAGPAEFQSLMRITHTLKGAAANVGQDTIQTIAHNLETVFRALLTPEVVLDAEIKTLLYRNYELLRLALQQELVQDHSHDAQLLQQATDILDQLQAQFGDATAELPAPPPAAELGFDLTEAIFETGVEARLKDFEALLARQPTPAKIQAYWHNQVDVFCRVADSLSLPGFRAVVEAGETAIATHPDQTLIIAPLLLANLRAAQAQILEGDRALTTQSNRTVSGSVSPELAHWLTPDHADASEPLDELDATPDVTPVPEQVVLASDLTPAKSEQPGSQPSSWAAPTPASDLAELVTAAPTSASVLSKSLRIDLTQLEQINHLVGELRINQNQMVLRDRQVQDVVHQLDTDLQQHRHTLQQLQASLPAEQQPALLGKAIDQTHRLKEGTNDLTVLIRNTDASLEREQQLAKQLQDQMDSARMVPLASMLKRFPPMVKQLALIHKKPVELHLQGTDVCVDKTLLENLYDALLHLVRNAFDHGLESAEQRRQADKPEQGNITIAAANQGNRTVIRVQDDGQGLNVAQICERAVARGLLSAEAAQNLKQQDLQQQSLKYQDLQERLPAPSQLEARLLDLLCTPGFSTVTAVSELSGRGVGLDVVKTQLAKIKGQLQVQSQPGQGCCFTLQIRESLLNARLLICQAGQAVYGFVTNEIEQVLIPGAKLRSLAGQKVLDWNQADQTYTVPIYGLAELFPPPNRWSGFPIEPNPEPNPALNSEPNPEPSNPDPTHPGELAPILTPQRDTCPVLLLRSPAGLVGLEVTQIWDEQELVIKPIAATIVPPSYVYGCTVLTNGQLALVLDGVLLVQWAQQQGLRRVQGDR